MLITLIVKILPPLALFILFINSANAAYPAIEAFTPPPKSYNVKKNVIEVTNIAKIPSQGGREICSCSISISKCRKLPCIQIGLQALNARQLILTRRFGSGWYR